MAQKKTPLLAIVVPCYDEAAGLEYTMERLSALLQEYKAAGIVSDRSAVWYVDDGSRDATWSIIEARCAVDASCKGIKLAANVGHQNALLAGLLELPQEVDCAISLDADLQDDASVMKDMLRLFAEGYEQVYGVRSDRDQDTFFKRQTAGAFYKVMGWLRIKLVPQHADFRLSGRRVLDALKGYEERNLFLRGIFPSLGFRQATVSYSRLERQFGSSKYPLSKMIGLAWQGITSFSTAPLRFAGLLSLLTFLLAVFESFRALFTWLYGYTVEGWSSLIITILYLGAIQLFSLAVIGEYLAKIYMETKRRPRYIVDRKLGTDADGELHGCPE